MEFVVGKIGGPFLTMSEEAGFQGFGGGKMSFISTFRAFFSPRNPSLAHQFNAAARHYYPHQMPDFDPQAWHSGRNNCYAYALNIPEHGWGLPGQLMRRRKQRSGLVWDSDGSKAIPYFDSLLRQDGLVRIDRPDRAEYPHILCLALNSVDQDFHFYRLDSNDAWSHKAGCRAASDKDDSGNLILSPESCNRGRYNEFVGYYTVPAQGISYVLP